MCQSVKTNMRIPNGYIVKLYRRAENVSQETIIDESMFMTWMNFDCMDVDKIYDFREYSNSVDVSKTPPKEIYASWQKIFLYNLSQSRGQIPDFPKEELLFPNDELREFPLITLSMIKLQKQPDGKRQHSNEWYEGKLQQFLRDHVKTEDAVKGELYGSLAVHDYVLVLRGNDYRELDSVLTACKQNMQAEGIIFNKIYTIAGIDRNHLESWKTEGLQVSVRLSCTSETTIGQLKDKDELNEAIEKYEIYSILGKYDYDIVGKVKSPEKFVALFLKGRVLSAFQRNIHKSNTRFFNVYAGHDSSIVCFEEEENLPHIDLRKNADLWAEFYELYSQIDSLPPGIMEALSKLVVRTFQVIITTSHIGMFEDLKKKLHFFLEFMSIHQDEFRLHDAGQDKVLDVYANMINTFNLLLDNCVSEGMSDFEAPQNVLRYSGAGIKVLLAYSSYVDRLIEILAHNRNKENKNVGKEHLLKYIVLVTADPIARISATVSLSFSEYYRFINISIPIDLIFEVRSVLPWVTHEAGHFIRAGWNRSERNAAYYCSVSRSVINRLLPFKTSKFDKTLNEKSVKKEANPVGMGEKFTSYCGYVKQYFQMFIYRFATDYSGEFRIPYSMARGLLDDVEDITEGLQRIYEEAIADMFMIQVLGIENLYEYLKIQEAYFARLRIDINSLPQENISRIMAVSIVLEELPCDDYEKLCYYFSSLHGSIADGHILSIAKQLKEFRDYYILEPLIIFLNKYVKKGLEELLNEPELVNVREKIKDGYLGLKRETFDSCLQFVLQFS